MVIKAEAPPPRYASVLVLLALAVSVGAAARISGVFASAAAGRQDEKQLKKDFSLPTDPVRILNVRALDKPVEFDKKFQGGKDWLKGLELKLKNVSAKEIVFLRLDVNFPETASDGAEMSYQTGFGRQPGGENAGAAPLSLPPGGVYELALDEERYRGVVRFVNSRHDIDKLSDAYIRIGFVVFADGTAWAAGTFYRRDRHNPRRWVPLTGR